MGDRTGIAWTDATWNPWQGCHRVSPGCEHCYMFREKRQYGQDPDVVVRSKPRTFTLPLRLKAPQRVFTCSWSDFFIREADPWRDEAWAIIDRTRHLTYQILTKRIERVAARLPWGLGTPWSHVQVIASVENQEQADRRIPRLLAVNAAVRGVSYEPALGPVDFRPWLRCEACGGWGSVPVPGGGQACGRCLEISNGSPRRFATPGQGEPGPFVDWLIIGGESGPHARPFDLAWARSGIAQCRAAGIACFVKQMGARPVTWDERDFDSDDEDAAGTLVAERDGSDEPWSLRLRDRAGADPSEWPEDLRVREWPR